MIFFFFYFFLIIEMKHWTMHILHLHSTIEVHPRPKIDINRVFSFFFLSWSDIAFWYILKYLLEIWRHVVPASCFAEDVTLVIQWSRACISSHDALPATPVDIRHNTYLETEYEYLGLLGRGQMISNVLWKWSS